MGYVVINPANATYDGIYVDKDTAYNARDYWDKYWNEPMVYVVPYEGTASDLESVYVFMPNKVFDVWSTAV